MHGLRPRPPQTPYLSLLFCDGRVTGGGREGGRGQQCFEAPEQWGGWVRGGFSRRGEGTVVCGG